jgi:hypothetical protein
MGKENQALVNSMPASNKVVKYTIARSGEQAGLYTKTTKAIGELVGIEFGHQMRKLVLQLEETSYSKPVLSDKPTEAEKMAWGKEYDRYLKQIDKYDEHKAKVFVVILSHCEQSMLNRVEAIKEYKEADKTSDVVALLKMIKDSAYDAGDKKYPSKQAVTAWQRLMRVSQGPMEDLTTYYKRFISIVEQVERSYGEIAPVRVSKKLPDYDKDKIAAVAVGRSCMLAYLFMAGAKGVYSNLLVSLEDDFALGESKYPETVEDALQVLTLQSERHVKEIKKESSKNDNVVPDLSFVQPKKSDMWKKSLCFKCGQKGHKAAECPHSKEEQARLLASAGEDPEADDQQFAQAEDSPFSWVT